MEARREHVEPPASVPGAVSVGWTGPPDGAATDPVGALAEPLGSGAAVSVLFTPSRCEKRVALACARLEIPVYLPLREGRESRAGGRFKLPLFPGYVFASLSAESRRALVGHTRIARVIPVARPDGLLEELRHIHRALAARPDLTSTPALARGRRVRVIAGPMTGVVGRIADRRIRRSGLRLALNVTMLGQGTVVQIDAGDVELVSGRPGIAEAAEPDCAGAGRAAAGGRRGRFCGGSIRP